MEPHIFTKTDLEKAYNAGKEIIDHEWHMQEFHISSCKCVSPEYSDFNEWLEKVFPKLPK